MAEGADVKIMDRFFRHRKVPLPLTTFGYVLTLFYIYLCLFILLTPKNASEGFSGCFLIYGNCLTHDITLGLLTSNDYSFSFSACYISSSRRKSWSDN